MSETSNKLFKLLCATLLVSSLFSCLSVGTKIDPDRVNDIKTCVTTEKQILEWFGKPFNKGNVGGFRTLNYTYGHASVLGEGDSQNLTVYLNKEGQVIDFALNPTAVLMNIQDKCSKK